MPAAADSPDSLRPATIRAVRAKLLTWYDANRRDLPWRRRADSYAIWLSEIMLQQTRVETVIPYYEKFLQRFPSIERLAEADLEEVLAMWSGLGYYRRARALHETAGLVVREHGGSFPVAKDEILGLPGIGRYTAGAISSIAHGIRAPILDGNVIRIFSRWFRLGKATKPATLWGLAAALVPDERPGDFNQSMMELGATVCTPRSPACPVCPVAAHCEAHAHGRPEIYPEAPKRARMTDETLTLAVATRNGRVLLTRSPDRRIMKDLWEFPTVESKGDVSADLKHLIQTELRCTWDEQAALRDIRHSIMNRRILAKPFVGRLVGRPSSESSLGETRWVLPSKIAEYPVGGITKKVLRAMRSSRSL